jgi:predicted short-subunit dehydrogenase-like oxidoreductase (DUF2520 family)
MSRITIIGAGNVATQLTKRLYEEGHDILQVFNRSLKNATILANEVEATSTDNWRKVNCESDFYIISISDDAIASVAEQLSEVLSKTALIVHTSGATSSKVFQSNFENHGVFYPLQTFSKDRKADFEKLPFCIYGSNEKTGNQLVELANSICPNVYLIDDKQRAVLHVAAVFANNFTNYLIAISEQIIAKENIPFDLLKPLINETVAKINDNTPQSMQTGPARRGDRATLEKHQKYLEKHPNYKKVYELLSEYITGFYIDEKNNTKA